MPSQATSRIAANLRAARRAAGLTQRQLAERIDTDSFQVSRWERGAHRPADETLFALAAVLGMAPEAFYADPEEVAA